MRRNSANPLLLHNLHEVQQKTTAVNARVCHLSYCTVGSCHSLGVIMLYFEIRFTDLLCSKSVNKLLDYFLFWKQISYMLIQYIRVPHL